MVPHILFHSLQPNVILMAGVMHLLVSQLPPPFFYPGENKL